MQPHWITTALVAALAGAAGATLAHELLPERSGGSTPKQVALVEPEVEPARDYAEQLTRIEQRIAALELRPTPSAREVAVVAGVDEPQAVDALSAPLATAGAIDEPVLQVHVEQALTRIREEERAAREAEKEQKRLEQLDQQLEKLSVALGLGTDQVNDMRTLYEDQRVAKQDLQRMWEDGFDNDLLAQTKRDNASRYRAELERILTVQQLESFDMLNDNRQSRRNEGRKDNARRDRNGK